MLRRGIRQDFSPALYRRECLNFPSLAESLPIALIEAMPFDCIIVTPRVARGLEALGDAALLNDTTDIVDAADGDGPRPPGSLGQQVPGVCSPSHKVCSAETFWGTSFRLCRSRK